MDRARQLTDKKLKAVEKQISRVYKMHPALLQAQKKYDEYIEWVNEKTKDDYKRYVKETDEVKKAEYKKVYSDKIKAMTVDSKRYKVIVSEVTRALARANQDALDIVNDSMAEIYAINYNQVAVDCKQVGIKVNGS